MTSQDLANVYRRAERHWMHCNLRRRVVEEERQKWKDRLCARAVALAVFWGASAERARMDLARLATIEAGGDPECPFGKHVPGEKACRQHRYDGCSGGWVE